MALVIAVVNGHPCVHPPTLSGTMAGGLVLPSGKDLQREAVQGGFALARWSQQQGRSKSPRGVAVSPSPAPLPPGAQVGATADRYPATR
jgi:hypothetical protein